MNDFIMFVTALFYLCVGKLHGSTLRKQFKSSSWFIVRNWIDCVSLSSLCLVCLSTKCLSFLHLCFVAE